MGTSGSLHDDTRITCGSKLTSKLAKPTFKRFVDVRATLCKKYSAAHLHQSDVTATLHALIAESAPEHMLALNHILNTLAAILRDLGMCKRNKYAYVYNYVRTRQSRF